MNKIEEFWNEFLNKKKLTKDTKYYDAFSFGYDEWQDILLNLVLEGKKEATSSLDKLYDIENLSRPTIGTYQIVLDSKENPYCVIKTIDIKKIKFKDMTYDIVKLEGEDKALDTWIKNHTECFSRDCIENNTEFNPEEDYVLFEIFKVVYKKKSTSLKSLDLPSADYDMLYKEAYEEEMTK